MLLPALPLSTPGIDIDCSIFNYDWKDTSIIIAFINNRRNTRLPLSLESFQGRRRRHAMHHFSSIVAGSQR